MKISFIATVLNEEKTIDRLLDSLMDQTRLPEEIVIVDAGSSDNSIEIIKNKIKKIQIKNIKIKVFEEKNINRSEGRNSAIRKAEGEIIAVSDAGCTLDKNWLKEITKAFKEKRDKGDEEKVEVVAGFYLPTGESLLQKILGQLTSVPLNKIDFDNFLPSSRSLSFTKNAWEKTGGYPEELNYCEDLVFDLRLKKAGCKFLFNPKAIVYWPQKETVKSALRQFFNYAMGDGMAGERGPHYRKLLVRLGFLGALGIWVVLWKKEGLEVLTIMLLLFFGYNALFLSLKIKNPLVFPLGIILLPILKLTVISGFLTGLIRKKLWYNLKL